MPPLNPFVYGRGGDPLPQTRRGQGEHSDRPITPGPIPAKISVALHSRVCIIAAITDDHLIHVTVGVLDTRYHPMHMTYTMLIM